MKHVCSTSAVLALALALPPAAAAQSLGDVARKEEARRKQVSGQGKVYTNDALKDGAMAPPPVPSQATPSLSGAQDKPGEKAPEQADDPRKDEKYWRARVAEARDGLERAKTFQEALQSRINALSTDFVARDDPAQRSVIAANRQKALAELDRVKKDISDFEKQLRDIEEEARKAGAPPGWLR